MTQARKRAVLTQAIEAKVRRLNMDALEDLATALKVPMPEIVATPQRHRKAAGAGGTTGGAVLVGKGVGRLLSAREGARRLDQLAVDDDAIDWAGSELVGAGEVVSRLKVARATLDNWRKSNKVIALRKGLRNYVYPLRQFDRRAPVSGIDKVAPLFSSAEEAWGWLVTPNRITGGAPIDELRAGNVEAVVSAAEGALDYA